MTPDVSIVLIAFNDAKRLPRALHSLRDQTLANIEIIVVDDGSTDDTAAIVEAQAEDDARIRFIRLSENSGGCSRPRNTGIDAARAPWVMFCDSDDAMERHAAKTLLLAVEAANADVACGVVDRVNMTTGDINRWREELHEPAVLAGLDDRPELLGDTVSVNKIYRREFLNAAGIRFPEGILYEDQRFTFEALALAERIVVLSDSVYQWSVDSVSEEASITQRRYELRNVRDRITVNRLIDESIITRGLGRFQDAKNRKFIRHDLYLHLIPLLELDDDSANAVIAELAPYCATVDPLAALSVRPALRVALFHLLKGDLEHLRSALRALRWAASIDVPVNASADSVGSSGEIWACGHEDGAGELGQDARWWLDVTELRVRQAPISLLRPCHRVASIDEGLLLAGTSIDVTGLGEPDSAALVLMTGDRVIFRAPALVRTQERRWHWSTKGPWASAVPDAVSSAQRGAVALELTFGNEISRQPVRMPDVPVSEGRIEGVSLQLTEGEFSSIEWSRTSGRSANRLRRGTRRVAAAVARRLPAQGVVLWSLDGRSVGDSMLELARSLPDAQWVWERRPELLPSAGADVTSRQGRWLLGRARVVVIDAGIPDGIRSDAMVVRIQSDVPVVRVGRDAPDWDLLSVKQQMPAEIHRWDVMAVPSEDASERVADAIGFSGTRLVTGSLRGERAARITREEAREYLGVQGDRAVVLWAPTALASVDPDDELQRDLGLLVDNLGDDAVILVRARRRLRIPATLRTSALDVSLIADAAMVLAASDVLITDASPLIFDAVRLGKPVIAWSRYFSRIDRESGFAIDLNEVGTVTDELPAAVAAVRSALAGVALDPSPAVRERAGLAGGAEPLTAFILAAAPSAKGSR